MGAPAGRAAGVSCLAVIIAARYTVRVAIQYVTEAGNVRGYHPDFLIERTDRVKELHEVKGGQYLQNPDTIRKHEAAKSWCSKRGMSFLVVTK